MQSCCLQGCESYKLINKQKIGYFQFPTENKPLLQKWLNQIRITNWIPNESHQICSTHFHVDDIDFTGKLPRLKQNAVPLIFPLKHFQSIYVDELASMGQQKRKIGPDSLKKQAIACKKKMDLIDSKSTSRVKQKSMILLCTPTEKLNKTPRIQINSRNQSNAKVKNIPIKTDKNAKSDLNPYILIVSENAESKISFTKPHKPKQAVLRIQIEKKINDIPCDFVLDNTINRKTKTLDQSIVTNTEDSSIENNGSEEIEIDDVTSTKKVIFKFHPLTGEITVQKRDKLTNKIIDDYEKDFNAKKINSFINNNAEENNENIEIPSENSAKLQEKTSEEKNSLKNSNLENGISSEQETIIKNTPTQLVTVELQKSTKEQEISTSVTETQKPIMKSMREIVESQKIVKDTEVSTTSTELQKTAKSPIKELQTSVSIVQSQKLTIKPTVKLQTSTPNTKPQKLVKEPEILKANGESQKPTKRPVNEAQTLNSTVELRTSKRLAKEPQILTKAAESNTPATKPAKVQTQSPVVESKVLAEKSVIEQPILKPAVELKTPAKKPATEQPTSKTTVQLKAPAKKPATEQLTQTPTVQLKTTVKTSAEDQPTPVRIAASKTTAKQQILTPVVSLQRTPNKSTQLQNTSITKENAKTVNNKQKAVKATDTNKKRKSDVIVINTSEDEDVQSSTPTNNKKRKSNSNTVILQDQAVITIIE